MDSEFCRSHGGSISEESRIRSGPLLEGYTVGSFGRSLGHVAFRGLAPEGPPEVCSIYVGIRL